MHLSNKPPAPGALSWRPHRWLALVAGVALVATVALTADPAARPVTAATVAVPTAQAAPPATTSTEIVLLTGDRLLVDRLPDGELAILTDPDAPDLDIVVADGQTYVFPAATAGLIGEVLDAELFNVSKLLEYGYDAAHGLSVIVSGQSAAVPMAAGADMSGVAGAARSLSSIGATALTLESPGDWWAGFASDPAPAGMRSAAAPRVWLDELVQVSLAESVAQVGAPQAWDAGYDGSGLTIAILDTGIDDTHPDLAGKVVAAENFTTEEDASDGHGHGTHVAGIAAGTGAGSGGTYTGVAPGAQLLNGKVCNRGGNCATSWIIEGMEWAASQADVINMSLGGPATDGTDLLSEALNQLSAEHDVLFVVAAGNDGPGAATVGAPGAADAALTIGSVNKNDQLAGSSSRGPRVGDFAIKPDMTAPGVAISAPRADGTSMGTPVNDLYTTAGGTSMAAPHVAGAAAILLQADGDFSAEELKAALATTAVPHPTLSVYQQGAGRLDLPAALDSPVLATSTPLDLGFFPYPHDDIPPATSEIGYRNRSSKPVTLELEVDVTSTGGAAPPAGTLTVSPTVLTIDPGATATATVTVDVTLAEIDTYGGTLRATSDGEAISVVPVGFTKEPEMYDLVVEATTRSGEPAEFGSRLEIVNVDGSNAFASYGHAYVDGSTTVRLPAGVYSLMSVISTAPGNTFPMTEATFAFEPEVDLRADTTVVFDATESVEITMATPEHPNSRTLDPSFGYLRRGDSGNTISGLYKRDPAQRFFAIPSEAAELGQFEFFSDWRLGSPADPSYIYRLLYAEPDRIPSDMSYVAYPDELATLNNPIHSGLPARFGEGRHSFRPWQATSAVSIVFFTAPLERTDYVSANDTRFLRQIRAPQTIFREELTSYEPGEFRDEPWVASPVRPDVRQGNPVRRIGDNFQLAINEWVDTSGHYGDRHTAVDTVEFRLYQDDSLIAQAERPTGTFPVAPSPASYRLEVDVERDAPDYWLTSTATSTTWTVESERPQGGSTVLPLLMVDYHPVLDVTNRALHPRERRGPDLLDLTVRHQSGGGGHGPVAGARLWVSYDDGDVWYERPGRHLGDGDFQFVMLARNPQASNGFVSLRVEAWDADGNSVEQEITRAWQLPGR